MHATIHRTALHAIPGLPEAMAAASSPLSSPELHTRPNLSLSPLPTGGDVVSPRPMLSPKASFTNDPMESITHVEHLERIVAQEPEPKLELAAPQASAPVLIPSPALSQRSMNGESKDKTLLRPPVPSSKDIPASVTPRARADTLFPPGLVAAGMDETPPMPTLAALRAPRTARLHLNVDPASELCSRSAIARRSQYTQA